MYLGFQALYLMAMACYALAFVSEWIFTNKDAIDTATPVKPSFLEQKGLP
jgi:hypothetical protein